VRLVQEAGGRPIIGDSPGGPFSPALLRGVYQSAGLLEVAEETGAELNFDVRAERIPAPEGRLIKMLDICGFALDADVIISLPKLKTHGLMGFTGATKNLFGLVPGVTKAGYHAKLQSLDQFAEMLLDILTAVKPAFHLMDGIVGMDGDGPSAGRPYPAGILLCSTDAVALDLVATHLAGLPLERIAPLRVARRRGLTTGSVQDVQVVGEPLESVRLEGFRAPGSGAKDFSILPQGMRQFFVRQLVASPQVGDACVGCGICAQNCPMQTIRMEGRRAVINLSNCIRCYCCHELCPEKAITLKQSWVQRLVR
jgi:uncharacterized protein (DUF362 family)/Pyruvate/2-oxoacid:ferredoxin oxidoreductase delta subunit